MSLYKEGQPVQTPQGQGKIATDQVDEQVYVLLNDTGNLETFRQEEVTADEDTGDTTGAASLSAGDADAFDFDDFLDEENQKPKDDY